MNKKDNDGATAVDTTPRDEVELDAYAPASVHLRGGRVVLVNEYTFGDAPRVAALMRPYWKELTRIRHMNPDGDDSVGMDLLMEATNKFPELPAKLIALASGMDVDEVKSLGFEDGARLWLATCKHAFGREGLVLFMAAAAAMTGAAQQLTDGTGSARRG